MIPNRFLTKLPFYRTSNFNFQPELQKNKSEATEYKTHSTPNPKNWFPEFIFARDWATATITAFEVWNTDTNTLHQAFPLSILNTLAVHQYQQNFSGVHKIVMMFTGYYGGTAMTCGNRYQYRITDSDGRKYYSEYWEVVNLEWFQAYGKYWTKVVYGGLSCMFANIKYNPLTNFSNTLWLNSEGITPETNIDEDNEVDIHGKTVSQSHRIEKFLMMSIPHVSVPTLDAINTLPMYAKGDKVFMTIYTKSGSDPRATVQDVEIEKPSYQLNEIAPSIKLKLRIEESIVDAACCDMSDIICYSGKTPPILSLSKPSGTVIKAQKNSSTLYNALQLGIVPAYTVIKLYYRKQPSTTWILWGATYSYLQLAAGINITGLAAGTYDVAYTIEPMGVSGCTSEKSPTANITIP